MSAAAAGLVIGLLVIGWLEYRDSSLRSETEALKALAVPVLGQVPLMISDREYRAARRRALDNRAGGTAVLLAAAVVLVMWRLQS